MVDGSGALRGQKYEFRIPSASDGGRRSPLRCVSIQKCPEPIPSLPGAYDGRGKWASTAVIPGSGRSVTTPSWGEEAQAESRHPNTKATIPDKTARLFTKANVRIAESDATPVDSGSIIKSKAVRKKFCAK